jgi:glycolate oxidase FAD binding subunit
MPDTITQDLCEAVRHASAACKPLLIQGNGSKNFYGPPGNGDKLSTSELSAIVEYEPSELFITARAGTLLSEVEAALDDANQILPFEPPQFGRQATIGGTVACGLSGPRRPYSFAMRDCILGTDIINGKGEHLTFGGQVVKNVAGYDVSRFMCGAMGTLGIITEISFKTIPKPESEITLVYEQPIEQALDFMQRLLQTNLPVTASYHENNRLYLRFAGNENVIEKVKERLGGEQLDDSKQLWHSVKEHQRDFFDSDENLWRCMVPANCGALSISGESVFEWNGGLRWYTSDDDIESVMKTTKSAGGYATLFRTKSSLTHRFTEPAAALKKLHLKLKQAFDPGNILNSGRMYPWL